MQRTQLAQGQITPTTTISVELVQADDSATVFIRWPDTSTQVSPRKLPEVIAAACRILAASSTELSRIRAGTR